VKFSSEDLLWMQQALELAKLGLGHVEPNPLVGCVLVRDEKLIAGGYHAQFGGQHAERAAIAAARNAGKAASLVGCTAYVTLEPCCHHGKTPPCTDLLLEVGVKRVVTAMLDPYPAVSGQGVLQLQAAGVQVDVGLERERAQSLNAAYLKRLRTGRPWVIAKWAMSLDGRIATASGHSQWISSETSRETVHQLRSRVDAIIVGRGTAEKDDPLLTARLAGNAQPARTALRVVIDSKLSLSPTSQLAQTAKPYATLIWTGPCASSQNAETLQKLGVRVERCGAQDNAERLDQLLQFLVREYAATNVLVEGGGQLLGSLFDLRQIDQCEVFIAPKLIGGNGAISPIAGLGVSHVPDGPTCYDVSWQPSGIDQHLSCRLRWL
jgi:diaminohydroxyphosphoribosylaminopyrimidine deaminase / 5-amino-6-(5-phosphoribosylamino)uracil reductase